MAAEPFCINCVWAEWQRTKTGRVKHAAGRCVYEIPPAPAVPIAVSERDSKWPPKPTSIWPDMRLSCPTFEPKD